MNGTPRLRSAYPATPTQSLKAEGASRHGLASARSSGGGGQKLPDLKALQPPSKKEADPPLIPFETIDAPSQRLYIAGVYAALIFWRLYDFYHLTLDESESLWLFMKWVSIDGVFLFGLPGLRIPWLEWSSTTMTILFMLHALFDGVLMFRVQIPLGSGIVALSKLLYDREIAVSERRVKPASILHNPDLILGRQIIHILPEGSATLNPAREPLCIGSGASGSSTISLPIRINQTNPISIELVRYDLDTFRNESILIGSSQVKRLRRDAERDVSKDPSQPLLLQYPVKKTGLYRLHRVVDETKLEVQMRSNEALVVTCPTARLVSSSRDKCRGELSDLSLEVRGTPPLQVKYRKSVNGEDKDVSYHSIHPEDFVSPLMRSKDSRTLISPEYPELSWAQPYTITVPLNETLSSSGNWFYTIEHVTDACNNKNIYFATDDDLDSPRPKQAGSQESILVHERPRMKFQNHKTGKPNPLARGTTTNLPIEFFSTGKSGIKDTAHHIEYSYVPYAQMDNANDGSELGTIKKSETLKTISDKAMIRDPGLYTLRSVSTSFCAGEVFEPAACIFVTPDPPSLVTKSEPIEDRCAGNPIGLRVSLDFAGTPPFEVQYTSRLRDGSNAVQDTKRFEGLRGQVELKPPSAGDYVYTFNTIRDSLYGPQAIPKSNSSVLNQSVKPAVSAMMLDTSTRNNKCINDSASYEVRLQGEAPWRLEYEIIHNGKRRREVIDQIQRPSVPIETGQLANGGEYTVALINVEDARKCREPLEQEAKIFVRHQMPKAWFGSIEGKRSVQSLERKGVDVPLRLSGEGPWHVEYRDADGTTHSKSFTNSNPFVKVDNAGTIQLLSVRDKFCPGTVDHSSESGSFEVLHVARPSMSVPTSELMQLSARGEYVRKDICEGDEDVAEVTFAGKAPFDFKYRESANLDDGHKAAVVREYNAPLSSAQIKMETGAPGEYKYTFTELGDYNYDHRKQPPLVIQQRVHSRPSATFASPGKVYSFCQGQEQGSNEEVIPLKLSGKPPFNIELELKHQAKASKPQTLSIPNIMSKSHSIHIPHSMLQPGNSALTIRRIRDEHGCERFIEPSSSPRVQIAVHDLPSINAAEERMHYCVGERIAFTISGVAPYEVFYTFQGRERRASVDGPTFRRFAEAPGNYTITGVTDAASSCRRSTSITKEIHPMPSVKVSKGRESRVDIHAGSETEILFEFGGVPPFEFTYTRSENMRKGDRKHGQVLETKTLLSDEPMLRLRAGDEGTYEVVAIRDRYCSFTKQGGGGEWARSQGLLMEA